MLPTARDGSRFLAALPTEYYAELRPRLEAVTLEQNETVHEPGGASPHVYFPTGALISLVAVMKDASSGGIEVGVVGTEGVSGIEPFFGNDAIPLRAFTQIRGAAFRMPSDAFTEVCGRGPLHDLIARYTQAFFNTVARIAGCNCLHEVEERCARWLLMAQDATGSDELGLTHEFLSQMLGVRRASVTVAAGILQRAGYVDYRFGSVRILNGPALEAAACNCYHAIRATYDELLG